MKLNDMAYDMFYGAGKQIFERAEQLKSHFFPAEKLLWDYLKDGKLGAEFKRRHPASLYVLDFYCHELKMVVEIEDTLHHLEDNKAKNPEREKALADMGIEMMRFTNREILTDVEEVLSKIKRMMYLRKNVKASVSKPAFEIIPAIDIIDGKCVRLTQGDYDQKTVYKEHPLEVARRFEDSGLRRLHLVDLDGAKSGKVINWKVLEAIAGRTKLVIDFGGGIKTENDLAIVFESGASMATIGSMAVKDEETFTQWIKQYGAAKFMLGADVKDEKIAVSGWQETTTIWIYDFLQKYLEKGVENVFCTDVSKDGLLQGPAIDLYKSIIEKFPSLYFIASGGVSSIQDLDKLQNTGCKGAIVGKAIYEGKISLEELRRFG